MPVTPTALVLGAIIQASRVQFTEMGNRPNGDKLMKKRMKGYQKAGAFGLFGIIYGVISLLIPSDGFGGYFMGPMAILAGVGFGWFWYKGKFGSELDRDYVEKNF